MLLDDSIELEYNDYSASAEPLPVNWDIELSKIWISSNLLSNRKKAINSNETKPFIRYTLEKPDESKSFSLYTDEDPQSHESQSSSDVASGISHHKLINSNTDKFQIQQELPSLQNAVEWNDSLGIHNKKETPPLNLVNSKRLDDSLRLPHGAQNTLIRKAGLWEKEMSNTFSIREASGKVSVDNLACRMAEILSEDEPFETNWCYKEVIEGNQVTTDSTLDSIAPSTKDSLEELYYSDEDDNQFDAKEYKVGNLESESSEKKHSCSIYTENFYIQEQTSSNVLEQAENNYDKTVNKFLEETKTTPMESPKNAVNKVSNQTQYDELDQIATVVNSKESGQELSNTEVKSDDRAEKIVEFPIAYKRPPLQEFTNKTKSHKEKKKAKKTKISIPLEDLFQKEEADRFQVPVVDEFYENLVHQGKCQPHIQETNTDGSPFINCKEELQSDACTFSSTNSQEILQTELFWDSAQTFIQSLGGRSQSSSPPKIVRIEKKTEAECESKASLDTFVIDNIHLNVSKENIESFILGYGELKNLTIERHEKFQRAILQMDFNVEVDWIIDCLNDTQPFGSFDKEVVKCYRQK